MDRKEILIRAVKTFAQAFLGVLIPEICAVLNGGFTEIRTFGKVMLPFVAAGLAAGISAAWNIIQTALDGRR